MCSDISYASKHRPVSGKSSDVSRASTSSKQTSVTDYSSARTPSLGENNVAVSMTPKASEQEAFATVVDSTPKKQAQKIFCPLSCDHKGIKDKKNFKQHMQKHFPDYVYVCQDCTERPAVYTTANEFTSHHSAHHPKGSKCFHAESADYRKIAQQKTKWACVYCRELQPYRDVWIDHLWWHHTQGSTNHDRRVTNQVLALLQQDDVRSLWDETMAGLYGPREPRPILSWEPRPSKGDDAWGHWKRVQHLVGDLESDLSRQNIAELVQRAHKLAHIEDDMDSYLNVLVPAHLPKATQEQSDVSSEIQRNLIRLGLLIPEEAGSGKKKKHGPGIMACLRRNLPSPANSLPEMATIAATDNVDSFSLEAPNLHNIVEWQQDIPIPSDPSSIAQRSGYLQDANRTRQTLDYLDCQSGPIDQTWQTTECYWRDHLQAQRADDRQLSMLDLSQVRRNHCSSQPSQTTCAPQPLHGVESPTTWSQINDLDDIYTYGRPIAATPQTLHEDVWQMNPPNVVLGHEHTNGSVSAYPGPLSCIAQMQHYQVDGTFGSSNL